MTWIEGADRPSPGFTARLREPRAWFQFKNSASDEAELLLFDEIGGWGTYADEFVEQLKTVTAPRLTVRVNSPGGSVFEGIAVANALRAHPAEVTVRVEGLAASIASVIAVAGDRLVMMPQSMLMIHDASGLCIGQAGDMRQTADLLDKLSENLAGVYAERAGGTVAEWRDRMLAETWYYAQEAVDAGLADEVMAPRKQPDPAAPANTWDLSIFRYAGRDHAPPPLATAVAPHSTTSKEGSWNGPGEEKKLPSPVPVAAAKKMYGWYDGDAVEDGAVPKSGCKLPHHFVSADGTPGAASLNGVRNALARLPQTDGLTDDERATIERHLRGHLPDDEDRAQAHATETPPVEPAAGPTPSTEEDDMSTLSEGLRERLGIDADAELDDDALLARLDEQLAAVTAPPALNPQAQTEPTAAAALPPGTVAIDEATLADLREKAEQGVVARARQLTEDRDRAIEAAISEGKTLPARREHWQQAWAADPDGTRDMLASLAPGLIPLADVGEPGSEPTSLDEDALYDRAFSIPGKAV